MKRIPVEIKDKMIQESRDKVLNDYGTTKIHPCGNKRSLDECFTIDESNIIFWYNVKVHDGMTTKITVHPMPK